MSRIIDVLPTVYNSRCPYPLDPWVCLVGGSWLGSGIPPCRRRGGAATASPAAGSWPAHPPTLNTKIYSSPNTTTNHRTVAQFFALSRFLTDTCRVGTVAKMEAWNNAIAQRPNISRIVNSTKRKVAPIDDIREWRDEEAPPSYLVWPIDSEAILLYFYCSF